MWCITNKSISTPAGRLSQFGEGRYNAPSSVPTRGLSLNSGAPMLIPFSLPHYLSHSIIKKQAWDALQEDLGSGDCSANLCPDTLTQATLITREAGIFCGRPWAEAVLAAVDPLIQAHWQVQDGQALFPGQILATFQGPARTLLTAERTLLNFIQSLSGTATTTHHYVAQIKHTKARLLDTRKTIPGLRLAQKYAVLCGGGHNHRLGLFDAILIKENHIYSLGSVTQALQQAQALKTPDLQWIELEVETQAQLEEALQSGLADRLLLDNFKPEALQQAMTLIRAYPGKSPLIEASGGITLENIEAIAESGVDFISCGALTKHLRALDLSLTFAHLPS